MKELSGVWVCKAVTYKSSCKVNSGVPQESLLLIGCCISYFSHGCDKVPGKCHLRKLGYGLMEHCPLFRESMAPG